MLAGGSFGRRATPTRDYRRRGGRDRQGDRRQGARSSWSGRARTTSSGGRYRPMFVHSLRPALDADGKHRRLAAPRSSASRSCGHAVRGADGARTASTRPRSRARPTCPMPCRTSRSTCITTDVGVPVLWWRSVGHTHTAFATETLIDELAACGGQGSARVPAARSWQEHPRHAGVLELAAEKAGWGSRCRQGRARGIAVHESLRHLRRAGRRGLDRRGRRGRRSSGSCAPSTAASRSIRT